MADNQFQPALVELKKSKKSIYGPKSFQNYCQENDLPNVRTADKISVDYFERLNATLKQNDTMVFRVGKPKGETQTNFILAKVPGKIKDFFLFDDIVFSGQDPVTFIPTTSFKKVYPFLILPKKSESFFINFGLASGLIGHAIGLDEPDTTIVPTTCKSTFSFHFSPHSSIKQKIAHTNGQVEIDAIFLEKRNGKDSLFVIEGKSNFESGNQKSLAKHKLVYPVLSLSSFIPKDMEIVPIYIKIEETNDGLSYQILECSLPDPRKQLVHIDDLQPLKFTNLTLPNFFRT